MTPSASEHASPIAPWPCPPLGPVLVRPAAHVSPCPRPGCGGILITDDDGPRCPALRAARGRARSEDPLTAARARRTIAAAVATLYDRCDLMKHPLFTLPFLGVVMLAVSAFVACGGNGTLSPEDYFQRLEEIQDGSSDRADALREEFEEKGEAASTEEERVDRTRDFFDETASNFSDTIDDLNDLKPPAEADGPHNDLLDALSDALELLRVLVDELEDVESELAAQDVLDGFEDDIDQVLDRLDNACVDLQDVADANVINVDLECLE